MLKKTITYENLDGQKVTEDHYFHLNKADLIKMEVSTPGGLQKRVERVIQSEDGKEIIAIFEDLLAKAYGRRTEDGRFLKDAETTKEFMSGEAYSELFMELVTDAEAAAEFINRIVPTGLDQDAARIAAKAANEPVSSMIPNPGAETPALEKAGAALGNNVDPTGLTNPVTPQVLTRAQIVEMDSTELRDGLVNGRFILP